MADEAAHLTLESLEEYFRLGAVSVFSLSVEVDARLEIDPVSEQLRLFVPAKGGIPEVADLERIRVDRIDGVGATSVYRLIFDARQMHYAAYQLVESIVGYLREGASFRHAVSESIADMKDLLANRRRLSDEEEIGLWGELLVLEHLVQRVGEAQAMESWLGPAASEHDFSFADFAAEVKTTRAETRRHQIGSDTQLEPSPGCPLYLVSIQATLAGDSNKGRALPQVVAALRNKLDHSRSRFDATLHDLRYYDDDADLYRTEFQLRASPRAYLIDSAFPAITRSRLEAFIPNLSLIADVRYRVDVSSLEWSAAPAPLDEFCEVPDE